MQIYTIIYKWYPQTFDDYWFKEGINTAFQCLDMQYLHCSFPTIRIPTIHSCTQWLYSWLNQHIVAEVLYFICPDMKQSYFSVKGLSYSILYIFLSNFIVEYCMKYAIIQNHWTEDNNMSNSFLAQCTFKARIENSLYQWKHSIVSYFQPSSPIYDW